MPWTKNCGRASSILSTAIAFLISAPAFAQGDLLWAKAIGGNRNESVNDVAVDDLGNIAVTGAFSGTVDFGGGPIVSSSTSGFVALYDKAGEHIWSLSFYSDDDAVGSSVAVDSLGNVIVTGRFRGAADFGGDFIHSQGTLHDGFVAKYDSLGNHVWSRSFAAPHILSSTTSIAVDADGNVVVAGGYIGTIDFGGGPLISAGNADIYLAKYDADGIHLWSQRIGDTEYDAAFGVDFDALGNIVLCGRAFTADQPQSGPYIAKFDQSGNLLWSRLPASTRGGIVYEIAADRFGNVVVTGRFVGTVDFGGGAIDSVEIRRSDIFVAKYDSGGNHSWSRAFGGIGSDGGRGIAVDALGNVAITGSFNYTVDFGGGPITYTGSFSDGFVAQYDRFGNHIWSRGFGDTGQENGNSVAVDAVGNVIVVGRFGGTVDFGGSSITAVPTLKDGFVVKYTGDPGVAAAASAGGSGEGGGGGCFIASATYGTPMAGEIDALRGIRDAYLLDSAIGSAFVDTYYRLSPPIADAVSRSPVLQSLVRVILTPIVMISKGILATPGLILVVALAVLILSMSVIRRRGVINGRGMS